MWEGSNDPNMSRMRVLPNHSEFWVFPVGLGNVDGLLASESLRVTHWHLGHSESPLTHVGKESPLS